MWKLNKALLHNQWGQRRKNMLWDKDKLPVTDPKEMITEKLPDRNSEYLF